MEAGGHCGVDRFGLENLYSPSLQFGGSLLFICLTRNLQVRMITTTEEEHLQLAPPKRVDLPAVGR